MLGGIETGKYALKTDVENHKHTITQTVSNPPNDISYNSKTSAKNANYSYVSAGTFNLTLPSNTTSIKVTCIGGGGGGGWENYNNQGYGHGGGGGGINENVLIPIESSKNISVTIGSGGTGARDSSVAGLPNSGPGYPSYITYNGNTYAYAGGGGRGYRSSVGASGGPGGGNGGANGKYGIAGAANGSYTGGGGSWGNGGAAGTTSGLNGDGIGAGGGGANYYRPWGNAGDGAPGGCFISTGFNETKIITTDQGTISSYDPNTLLLLHGEDFTDSSQYGRAVTNNGSAITADGKFGKAFKGSGAQSVKVEIPALGTGDYTIDFWTRMDGVINYGMMCGTSYGDNDTPGGFVIAQYNTTGKLYFWYTEGVVYNKITDYVIPLNTWIHIAMVRNNGITSIYANGIRQGEITQNVNLQRTLLQILNSNYSSDRYYNGAIDEFRVSDIARWTGNFTPPTAPYSN